MIGAAVSRAKELSEEYNHYCRDNTATRRCEKELLWCGQCFEMPTIRVLDLDRDIGDTFPSGIFVSDGAYDILVRQDLDPAYRRLVICKEIFHIVLDSPDVRNMDIASHVEEVVADLSEELPRPSVIVEFAAYAAAMEFLFPHAERVKHAALGTPLLSLAAMYDLPVDIIDFYMSETMIETLDPGNGDA